MRVTLEGDITDLLVPKAVVIPQNLTDPLNIGVLPCVEPNMIPYLGSIPDIPVVLEMVLSGIMDQLVTGDLFG